MVPYGVCEKEEKTAAAQNRGLTQGEKFLLNRSAEGFLFE